MSRFHAQLLANKALYFLFREAQLQKQKWRIVLAPAAKVTEQAA